MDFVNAIAVIVELHVIWNVLDMEHVIMETVPVNLHGGVS